MLLTPKIINEDILCYDEMWYSLNTGKNNWKLFSLNIEFPELKKISFAELFVYPQNRIHKLRFAKGQA